MATYNATAFLWGGGLMNVVPGGITTNNKASFSGSGLLDTWRVTNRYEYDPNARYGPGDMATRKSRMSQEGFFGDD